jgi:hypothetical protein
MVDAVLKALNFKTKGGHQANTTRNLHIEIQDATSSIHAETTRTIHINAN